MSDTTTVEQQYAWFTKGTKRDVVDGKKAPWMVVVPIEVTVGSGDLVKTQKSDGTTGLVRLVTEYPYVTAASNARQRRWTFTSVEADGTPDRIARENAALDAQQASRTDLSPVDGRPLWWSRREDGSVRWPQTDQVWADRDTGELGVIVRDQTNAAHIGWYPIYADVEPSGLDEHFADGVRREAGSTGQWVSSVELMNEYEFFWKRKTLTARRWEWARANGYAVKDQGALPRAVVAAYEAAQASGDES